MLDTIFNHKSIRKYKDKTVENKVLDEILQAGIRASNTGSMQAYSIIVTKDAEIRKQLWEQHFKQDMVKQAPVVLTFCADLNRFNKWCRQRNAEPGYDNFLWFYTASIDAVIASQNVVLAAETHGLGICYLGTTNYNTEKIIDILDIPKGVIPVTTVVLGYPDESPDLTPRFHNDAVIHYEKYKDFTEEDIDRIHKEVEESSFTKQLIEENQTENLAQIFTQKRYTKENNIHFSNELLKVLKKQKFI